MMSEIISSMAQQTGSYLQDVFNILLSQDDTIQYEKNQVQTFADKHKLNFYVYTIEPGRTSYEYLMPTETGKSQHYACLLYNKIDETYYAFYTSDESNEVHTIFLVDDEWPLQAFEDLVRNFLPLNNIDIETTEAVSHEDISTKNRENNGTYSDNSPIGLYFR